MATCEIGRQLARVYCDAYGLYVPNGILYNHELPRRDENFVTRKLARGVAPIARNLDSELALGILDSPTEKCSAALTLTFFTQIIRTVRPFHDVMRPFSLNV
jgi:GDP-D-mannose dehydratase